MKPTPGGRRSHAPLALPVVLLIVFGILLVAQVAGLVILGSEASGSTTNQVCQVNLWVIHIGCSEQTSSSPSAANAQTLATDLEPWFVLVDAVFIVAITVTLIFGAKSGRGAPSGRRVGR
jgi:hypothetical protein